MGVDVFKIIEAANTKPYGLEGFGPVLGLVDIVFSIDPLYLNFAAKKFGYDSKFVKLSSEVNSKATKFVENKVISYLLKTTLNFLQLKFCF